MALLGARVGFGTFRVLIVLSLSEVKFGGLVGQVSTASLIPELLSRNLPVFDFGRFSMCGVEHSYGTGVFAPFRTLYLSSVVTLVVSIA